VAVSITGTEIAAIIVALTGLVGTALNYAKSHEQGKRVDRLALSLKDTQAVVGDVRADHLPSGVLIDTIKTAATSAALDYAKDAIANSLPKPDQTSGLPATVVNVDNGGETGGTVPDNGTQQTDTPDVSQIVQAVVEALRKR